MNKATLLVTLSFLSFAFITNVPFVFSTDVEPVLDINGNPIFPGRHYYILPAIWGPSGGGLKLGKTGDSKFPATILQDYSEVEIGTPVKFSIPGISTGIIFTGTQLEIEFTEKPECAESSKWVVFLDYDVQRDCLGIDGGPEAHPGMEILRGPFFIYKYKSGYKLGFCVADSTTCLDIGRYDNHVEGGRRLNLSKHDIFEVVFVEASNYDEIIRSVA